jgi:hypothetical protein
METRRLAENNEPVGLAFTSVEALVDHLGDYQPWISVPMLDYIAVLRRAGIIRVQIDPAPTDGLWRWDRASLVDCANGQA